MCSKAPNVKELITSVGNSWIICRSKSYAGRTYYFNTSTGDAVWNISETEVEIAKNRTKILQSQPNFAIGDCPEPQEVPNDHSTLGGANQFSQPIVQSKICNKQIISNQSPTQSSNLQFNHMNPVPFDNPFVPTIGPALWNVSPQKRFVTPTWSLTQPLIDNHNADHVNINKAQTLSNRFKKYTEKLHNQPKITGVFKYKCSKKTPKSLGNQVQDNKNNVDLRLLLSLKRRKNILNEKESHLRKAAASTFLPDKHSEINQDGTHHQPFHLREKINGFNPTEVEEDNDIKKWHENLSNDQGGINPLSIYSRRKSYISNTEDDDDDELLDEENWNSQEDTNPVELQAVRSVLDIPENYNIWYLVTDSNVLINNIHLLNNILKADKQCRLMVPQQVMNKIQSATNSRLRLLAHRALYFIFRQVEANLASIDKNNEEIMNSNDAIFNCCVQLLEKGNRVVLLSDDIELHNNSNASNVQILTVSEIENLVKESKDGISAENSDEQNSKLARGRNIKITIANETNIQRDEDKCIKPEVLDKGICEVRLPIEKKACDVGVQADSVPLPKTIDDINNEIILPDSTKANDCIPFNKIGVPRHSPQNLSPKMRNTDKKKIWQRHKLRHSLSMTDYCATKVDESVTSICPVTNSNTHFDAENSTWGLYSHTSAESSHKYSSEHNDMSSDTSSFAAIRRVNPVENVTVDETSTSGMSNITSIIDTGSEKSILHKAKEEDDKHVMFEVTDVRMEEFLKLKSDEWVSRLVQIMEEALSQVLRLEPSSSLEHMPPPWTVHEAAECVKKFHHDSDVVDAANKFLQISLENGGLRGKIKSSINPRKFMELYSYSVYLIDALQGVLVENEDLQTAAESLSKLLSDIQNPHLDLSNQGSFNDHPVQENELKVPGEDDTITTPVNPDDNNKIEIPKKNKKNESPTVSPGKYNLRSKKSIEEKQDASDKVNSTKNIDTECSFFSSLFLKKNSSFTSNSEVTSAGANPNIGLGTSNDIQEKNRSPSLHQNKENDTNTELYDTNTEEFSVKILDEQPIVNEPKIIRNFSTCLKYEEKLKSKSEFISDVGEDTNIQFEGSMVNYEEDFTDDYYGTEEFDMENGFYNLTPYDDKLYDFEQIPEERDIKSSLQIAKTVDIYFDKTITFRHVMEKLEEDIRKAYSSIQDFCVKSCESLQTPDINADHKSQMRLQAEKSYTYIHKICDQLNSILRRENSDNSIFIILKRQEFEDIIVEDDDVEVYRTFLGNCLEQGNILLDSVALVLEASKEPTV